MSRIPPPYDPRPFLEAAKDDLATAAAYAGSEGSDYRRPYSLDAFHDSVRDARAAIDMAIELVNQHDAA